MTKEIKRCIAIMFPKDEKDRTQCILKRLRNNNDKDHHCAGIISNRKMVVYIVVNPANT